MTTSRASVPRATIPIKLKNELLKLKDQGAYTLIASPKNYSLMTASSLQYLTKLKKKTGVYMSLNLPCRKITEQLKNSTDLNKILFIDGTGERKEVNEEVNENCLFIQGAKSLTELSLTLSEACKNKEVQFVFFDSIRTLLVYNSLENTEQFLYYLINHLRRFNILLILASVDEEKSNKLIPFLSQFCDKCIKMR